MIVDKRMNKFFSNRLKQVFLYITELCNLRCIHCLYKPNLAFQLKNKFIPLQTAIALLSAFRKLGASKLTVIGGEPTLYDKSNQNKELLAIINEAKALGYEYIRLDTNGIDIKNLLLNHSYQEKLNELAFSLDGPTAEINDYIRGRECFIRCVKNIKEAIKLGYNVTVTCSIHERFIEKGDIITGLENIRSLIDLLTSLNVKQINFHPILKMGVPRDLWINDTEIMPEDWIKIEREIRKNIESGKFDIPIRIPKRFITRKEFDSHPKYYGYCPVKMGERILVHPNGILRVCALLIGTPYGVGRYDSKYIRWDDSQTNEILNHDLNSNTPCQNQISKIEEFLPLCISLKPQQEEYIWKIRLKWEEI